MSFSAVSLYAALHSSVPEGVTGLVVALSGGADSSALLSAAAVEPRFRGLPLRAVHVDHGLQAAAAEFRAVCSRLCSHLGVPLELIRVEVQSAAGLSLEAAARDARYAALAAEIRPGECLLTAHQREDQAETFLLQALRGAGAKGLAAMPTTRSFGAGWHVRPLLDVPRCELREFVELRFGEHFGQFLSTDPMNADLRFDRVYLRQMIWPAIEKRWPGAAIALSRAARHMAEAQETLELAAAQDVARLRDGDALSVPGLRALSHPERINAVRLWLSEAGAEAPSTARLGEALRQVFEAHEDHQPAIVWGDKALRRYRQRLFLTEAAAPRIEQAVRWTAALGSTVALGVDLGSLAWHEQRGGIATEKLPAVVTVRRREGGETLKPAVYAKTQTVQHLCQSLGVLPWMRDALPCIFAGDELIAVGDLWADARWCTAADEPGLGISWSNGPLMT
jgi:tRNA(Ile)-lysidine synthase